MSDILLVGLPGPEAGAIELLFARRWPSLRTTRLDRGERPGISQQDAEARACRTCVVDLSSTGLRQRNGETEAALMAFLDGRSAVLLSRDAHGDWLDQPVANASGQQIVAIRTPYSSAELLTAMVQIMDTGQLGKAFATSRQGNPAGHDAQPGPHGAQSANRPAGRASTGNTTRGVGLLSGSLPIMLGVFPQLRTRPLVLLAKQILAAEEAVLVHLNKDVMLAASVRQGWLATGIGLPILMKSLSTSTAVLLDQAQIEPLTHAAVELLMRERFGDLHHRMRHPLDTLVWELTAIRLKSLSLTPQGDLRLRLRRVPNFTRLNTIGPLDTQLAAICARMPQTLSGLARKFPGQEQQIHRFAVLSLMSGIGEVLPDGNATVMPMPQRNARQRGFFKSLLDRLL